MRPWRRRRVTVDRGRASLFSAVSVSTFHHPPRSGIQTHLRNISQPGGFQTFSVKELADRKLLVDADNRLPDQGRHRKNADFFQRSEERRVGKGGGSQRSP